MRSKMIILALCLLSVWLLVIGAGVNLIKNSYLAHSSQQTPPTIKSSSTPPRAMNTFLKDPARRQLISDAPSHAVTVGLAVATGYLIIPVTVADKRRLFLLDTGAPITTFPRKMGLASQPTTENDNTVADMDGNSWSASRVLLTKALLQGKNGEKLVWDRLPADSIKGGNEEIGKDEKTIYFSQNGTAGATPLLGNSAFEHLVITIDVAGEQLVVRNADFNPVSEAKRTGSSLLPLTRLLAEYTDDSGQDRGGYLIVEGMISGKRCRLMVDSGAAADGITVSHDFAASLQLLSKDSLKQDETSANWRIGAIKGESPIYLLDKNYPLHVDGIIGYALLKRCRVTIDYPRNQMLLEPLPR